MTTTSTHENPFVAHLNRYTTISSEHEAAFDEFIAQASWPNDLRIETQTEQFLISNFTSDAPVTIILTGNAGDGKTYLCRKVIEAVTGQPFGTWEALPEAIPLPNSSMTLRVIKDLSELGENAGRDQLLAMQENHHGPHRQSVFLMAANEGRLRALLMQNSMTALYKNIDHQLRDGADASAESQMVVINLNAATTSSYTVQTLEWITQDEHWHACHECPALQRCPIRHNAMKLAQPHVIKRLKLLYQTLEQLGEHATIRDMLIHLAYVTTSGLRCHHVINQQSDKAAQDALHHHVYYQNVWGQAASETFRTKVAVINLLRKLDVGENSVFELDDFILNGDAHPDHADGHARLFTESLDLNWKQFRQDRDAYVSGGASSPDPDSNYPIMRWLPHCRRKLFFEWEDTSHPNRLLPLLYITAYFGLIEDNSSLSLERTTRTLIRGLNRAFSGLFLSQDDRLFVTSQYAHAVEQPVPIVQFEIPTTYIELAIRPHEANFINRNMATLDLVIPPPPRVKADELRWPINLLMFEYLMRRANGSTANILANECELEIRQLKDALLNRFSKQNDTHSISFFAAENNRYELKKLQIERSTKS